MEVFTLNNTKFASPNITTLSDEERTKKTAYNNFINVLAQIIEKYGNDVLNEIEQRK